VSEFGSGRPPAPPAFDQTFRGSVAEVLSFAKTLAVFLVLAFFLRASVVEAFKIPSGSMIPTLRIGDHILVLKFPYGVRLPLMKETLVQYGEPKRGDVVVFTRPDDPATPDDESKTNIIKRVIGLPGEIVEVRDTQVYINNKKYTEIYARWEEGGLREGNFGPERVPAGKIFLLGDNRDHSRDSRFWPDAFLPMSRVKGRAAIIYWSWDSLSRIGTLIR
jgi:signal peptidase I